METFVVEAAEAEAGLVWSQVIAYHYALHTTGNAELLIFQWHPDVESVEFFQRPHLHIGTALARPNLPIAPTDIHKLHIATGQVTLPMFVRMLIEEFGVVPLQDDWDARLSELEGGLRDSNSLPDQ